MSFMVNLVESSDFDDGYAALREPLTKGWDFHTEDFGPFGNAQQRLHVVTEVRPMRFIGALGLENLLNLLS
jgi:hypothetical protein